MKIVAEDEKEYTWTEEGVSVKSPYLVVLW